MFMYEGCAMYSISAVVHLKIRSLKTGREMTEKGVYFMFDGYK